MSTRYVTRANKDLKIHDIHVPAATANFSMCPPKSKQQIEEEEEDDDDFSDTSLSDAHREEYPIAATESEDSDSESEDIEESFDRTTTQSVIYPNKRKKGETNTRSVMKMGHIPNFPYKYVPWCSKSSVDTEGKESWIDSWSLEHGKEPEEDRKWYHYLNIYGFTRRIQELGDTLVVASAFVQQNEESYFYHVLDGVKDGLALALKYKKYDLKLLCNSRTLAGCLRHIFQQADDGLSKTRRTRIRQAPISVVLATRIKDFVSLLKEIIGTHSNIMSKSHYFFVNNESTCVNQAAYHLAKQLSKKMKTAGNPEMKEIIRPIDFGEELKSILFEDACVGSQRYSQQRYSKLVK
ncbi:hypothetical protein MKW92_003071 [Papaver armeniacum]|nr:hypothetical protein MKW92_003071 [Papaver armeniacum]